MGEVKDKGIITSVQRVIDDNENVRCYVVVVEFNDKPNFKLGNCEIKQ